LDKESLLLPKDPAAHHARGRMAAWSGEFLIQNRARISDFSQPMASDIGQGRAQRSDRRAPLNVKLTRQSAAATCIPPFKGVKSGRRSNAPILIRGYPARPSGGLNLWQTGSS
jgi:hypothetical protein